uniref:Uncharacterized protein n=1 Tax=Cacopsylla melanoneura TaxID=428564 RepID=A0A8D9AH01_9HEMI
MNPEPERPINGSDKKNIGQQMTDLYYAMDEMHRRVSFENKELGKYEQLMTMPDVIYGDYTTNRPPATPPGPGPSKPEKRNHNHVYASSRHFKQEHLELNVRLMRRQLKVMERKVILLEQRIERQRANTMDISKTIVFLGLACVGIFVTKAFF